MPGWSKLSRVIREVIAGRRRHWPVHRPDRPKARGKDDGWSGVVNELKHSIGPDPRPRHVAQEKGRGGRAAGRHGKSAR
jgi:hypothetical protein